MAINQSKPDKHFPLFAHDNLLRRLFSSPLKYNQYIIPGQTAADLGCGPGFFTIALAQRAGLHGKVYAVDSDPKAIRAIHNKAARRSLTNIEARVSSAGDLSFIPSESVDFVLACGLLCSMSPQDRSSAISEIKRILKPGGKASFSAARGSMSYLTDAEWAAILAQFKVEERNHPARFDDNWALLSKK